MTIRCAVIGTSHAASVKTAWDEVSGQYSDVDLVFFAAPNSTKSKMTELRPDNGRLVTDNEWLRDTLARTSGGVAEIVPADYDVILLLGFRPRLIMEPPAGGRYSAAVRAAMYETSVKDSLLAQMTGKVKAVAADIPLFASAPPYQGVAGKETRNPEGVYARSVAAMDRGVYQPLGVRFLPQPEETVVSGCFTASKYARGSARLMARSDGKTPKPHARDDLTHMNAAFGKLVLAQAIPQFREAVAAAG